MSDSQNVEQRKVGRPVGGQPAITLTAAMVDQIRLDAQRMTCDAIATKYGVSGVTMRKYLLKHGVSTVEIRREFRRQCCRDASAMGYEAAADKNGVDVSDIRAWGYTYGKDASVNMPKLKRGPSMDMTETTYTIIGRLCAGEGLTAIAESIGKSRQWVLQVRQKAKAAGIPVKGGNDE